MASYMTADDLLRGYDYGYDDDDFESSILRRYGVRKAEPIAPSLSPQQEESLLRKIGSQLVGGIGAAGALLNVPGDMIRAALTGKDWMQPLRDPLNPAGRVTGREVLDYHGYTPKNVTPGLFTTEWWKDLPYDIAGFALGDLALDPTVWLTLPFGGAAATRSGLALKSLGKYARTDLAKAITRKAATQAELLGKGLATRSLTEAANTVGKREAWLTGTLGDLLSNVPEQSKQYEKALEGWFGKRGTTLAEHLDDPLGGTFGFGTPGAQLVFGRSAPFRKLARAADLIGEKMRFGSIAGISPISIGAGMFDPAMMGTITKKGQQFAPDEYRKIAQAQAVARYDYEPVLRDVYQQGWQNPVVLKEKNPALDIKAAQQLAHKHGNALTTIGETGGISNPLIDADLTMIDQADLAKLKVHLADTSARYAASINKATDMGMDVDAIVKQNGAGINYFHRVRNFVPEERTKKYADRLIGIHKGFMDERADWSRELPTGLLNEVSVDPLVSGIADKGPVTAKEWSTLGQQLKAKYGAKYGSLVKELDKAGNLVDKPIRWNDLAIWAGNLHPAHAERGIPAYMANPFDAALRRLEVGAQSEGAASAFHDFTSLNAGLRGSVPGKTTSIADLIGSTGNGLKQQEGSQFWMRNHFGIDKATGNPTKNLDTYTELTNKYGPLSGAAPFDNAVEWAKHMEVPNDVANEANRVIRAFASPDAPGELVNVYDRFNNWWKKWVTIPWPSFHMRNLISGLVRNWVGNGISPDGHNLIDAGHMLWTDVIPGSGKRYFAGKMTDKQATDELRRLAFMYKVHSHKQGFYALDEPLTGQLGEIPGVTMAWPRALGDKKGILKATDAVTRLGSATSYQVEGINRISPFLKFIEDGMSPEAAAQKVAALQVDYDTLTATERNVMRRIFPFYAFQKGVIPFTISNLIERPGGRLAQVAKGVSHLRSDQPILPEQVQETAAISLPPGKKGTQRYLTTLGLMEEQFYGMAMPGFRALTDPMVAGREFLREALSQTSVPIKGVAELFSGRSTYFGGAEPGGRELRALTPAVGQTVENIRALLAGDKAQRAQPIGSSLVNGSWPNAAEYLAQAVASRPLSMARDWTSKDKEWWAKLVNSLSGMKVYDASKAQLAAQEAELRRQEMVNLGGKEWTMAYFPKDLIPQLPPAKQRAIMELQVLDRMREKQRRQELKAAGKGR